MDQATFVKLARQHCAEAAADGVIAQLQSPSGRRPPQEKLERSAWYASLTADDERHLKAVVEEAAIASLFGVLCVLDGARSIEDGPDRGHLVLSYSKDLQETTLASSAIDMPANPLHELL